MTELNFWTPSARRSICGFAYFAHFSKLPDWLAWDTFELGNGCASYQDMHSRITDIRTRIRYDQSTGSDHIGCIQLVAPVFFPRDAWIPQPTDWQPRTQVPVGYDLGRRRPPWWQAASHKPLPCRAPPRSLASTVVAERGPRYGDPRLMQPRLGQATFRIVVLDAYARACAVTEEHSLPALEAAHIRSYAHDGPHDVRNGLLLRADLHRLFDTGYITVTPDLRLEVGARLRDEYHNGRSYYPLHGARLQVPPAVPHRPEKEFLEWHNEHVFRG